MDGTYNTIAGVVSQLRDDGWSETKAPDFTRSKTTTIIELTHPTKRGKITLVGPREQILGPKAIASILIQAGIIPR